LLLHAGEGEILVAAPRNEEACKTYWLTHAAALIAPRNEELEDGGAQEPQPPRFQSRIEAVDKEIKADGNRPVFEKTV
jgi:hypothetical protein